MNHDPRFLSMALDPRATLDDVLALAGTRYPVVFENVALGGMNIEVLQIADLAEYIDRLVETAPPGRKLTLPFWAKLWPASFPLAMYLSRLSLAPGARFLELGAGLGLCGLAAAKRGFHALITDIEPEALLFIKAGILKNGLEKLARPHCVDIMKPDLDGTFDVIAASEALYLPELHEPLARLLSSRLTHAEESQALLCCDSCREAVPFFARAHQDFIIQRTQSTCRSESGDSQTCILYRLRSRNHA